MIYRLFNFKSSSLDIYKWGILRKIDHFWLGPLLILLKLFFIFFYPTKNVSKSFFKFFFIQPKISYEFFKIIPFFFFFQIVVTFSKIELSRRFFFFKFLFLNVLFRKNYKIYIHSHILWTFSFFRKKSGIFYFIIPSINFDSFWT